MERERFFDLEIATLAPGDAPPADAHVVRIEEPSRGEVERRTAEGWFYKPCYVTYVLEVPASLDEYIQGSFRSGTRNKPRKLLRDVPRRYRLDVGEPFVADRGKAVRGVEEFAELYRRTIAARPRGKDRLSEHEGGFGPGWIGFYLYEGAAMVAGVLVHAVRRHLSVAYGAFDPDHRELDLEHFLIMQVIRTGAERGVPSISLGMDTNRYGHHLPLGLPAYKLRIGFAPQPYEPTGRELVRFQRFDVFEEGLFFYSYPDGEPSHGERKGSGRAGGIVGNLFTRGEPDLRPFHHHTAPPIRVYPMGP